MPPNAPTKLYWGTTEIGEVPIIANHGQPWDAKPRVLWPPLKIAGPPKNLIVVFSIPVFPPGEPPVWEADNKDASAAAAV